MEKSNYIVAIDLGSNTVRIAAGSKDPDGRLNVIDTVSKPMEGMSRGEVINIEQVTTAIRSAISELEEHLGIKVTEVYTGISGHDIQCADSSYYVYVSGEDYEIREEDVAKLHESMNNLQPAEGVCILGRTPMKYVIDYQKETMQPVGCFGQQLEATFNFVLANRNNLDRLGKAFTRLGITQRKVFPNAMACAEAVLSADEKELGAAVVNIGASCTNICIWQDNIMRYVVSLPIGSDAINRDIRSTAIPDRVIEQLKISFGYASTAQIPEDKKKQSIRIKGHTPRETQEISIYNLALIIEARLLDIIENIVEEIKESGYADKLGAGIILTGGGAYLNGIDTFFNERTKYDVRISGAYPDKLNDSSREAAGDLQLTDIIGLLLLGAEESGIEATDKAPLTRQEAKSAQTHAEGNSQTGTGISDKEQPAAPEKTRQGDSNDQAATEQGTPADKEKSHDQNDQNDHKSGKRKKGRLSNLKSWFSGIFDPVDDDEI